MFIGNRVIVYRSEIRERIAAEKSLLGDVWFSFFVSVALELPQTFLERAFVNCTDVNCSR